MLLDGIKNFGKAVKKSAKSTARMLADGMKDVKENGLPEISPEDMTAILNKRTLGLDGIDKDDKNKRQEEDLEK